MTHITHTHTHLSVVVNRVRICKQTPLSLEGRNKPTGSAVHLALPLPAELEDVQGLCEEQQTCESRQPQTTMHGRLPKSVRNQLLKAVTWVWVYTLQHYIFPLLAGETSCNLYQSKTRHRQKELGRH